MITSIKSVGAITVRHYFCICYCFTSNEPITATFFVDKRRINPCQRQCFCFVFVLQAMKLAARETKMFLFCVCYTSDETPPGRQCFCLTSVETITARETRFLFCFCFTSEETHCQSFLFCFKCHEKQSQPERNSNVFFLFCVCRE